MKVAVLILASVVAACQHQETTQNWNGGTLLLASYSSDGFALASDGKVIHPDDTRSESKKIFQVGDLGAAGLEGSVAVQESSGTKITAAVDVPVILEHWLSDHPTANIETANREVVALLVSEFKKFFETRSPGADAGSFRFRLVFWGFVDRKPLWLFNKFYVPSQSGEPPRVDTARTTPEAGTIWAWGAWLIQEELMGGNSPQLQSYKENSFIKLIRQSAKGTISKGQFLKAFDVILKAAESEEGIKFDPNNVKVGPPNHFATISSDHGFRWEVIPAR